MEQARQRLADAQAIGGTAKTHSGTWTLFSKIFVASGEFDQALSAMARRAKDAREQGDYEAVAPSQEEAAEFVQGARDFIDAIERMSEPG